MFEYLMLGDIRAQKYLKTGARTCAILDEFAFNTALLDLTYHYIINFYFEKLNF